MHRIYGSTNDGQRSLARCMTHLILLLIVVAVLAVNSSRALASSEWTYAAVQDTSSNATEATLADKEDEQTANADDELFATVLLLFDKHCADATTAPKFRLKTLYAPLAVSGNQSLHSNLSASTAGPSRLQGKIGLTPQVLPDKLESYDVILGSGKKDRPLQAREAILRHLGFPVSSLKTMQLRPVLNEDQISQLELLTKFSPADLVEVDNAANIEQATELKVAAAKLLLDNLDYNVKVFDRNALRRVMLVLAPQQHPDSLKTSGELNQRDQDALDWALMMLNSERHLIEAYTLLSTALALGIDLSQVKPENAYLALQLANEEYFAERNRKGLYYAFEYSFPDPHKVSSAMQVYNLASQRGLRIFQIPEDVVENGSFYIPGLDKATANNISSLHKQMVALYREVQLLEVAEAFEALRPARREDLLSNIERLVKETHKSIFSQPASTVAVFTTWADKDFASGAYLGQFLEAAKKLPAAQAAAKQTSTARSGLNVSESAFMAMIAGLPSIKAKQPDNKQTATVQKFGSASVINVPLRLLSNTRLPSGADELYVSLRTTNKQEMPAVEAAYLSIVAELDFSDAELKQIADMLLFELATSDGKRQLVSFAALDLTVDFDSTFKQLKQLGYFTEPRAAAAEQAGGAK